MLKAGRGESQRSEGSCGCRLAAGWRGEREPLLWARNAWDTAGTADGAHAGKRAGEVSGCWGCAGGSASPGLSCRRHLLCGDFYGFLLFIEQDFGPLCALASFDLESILEMQGKGWGWRTETAACLGRGGCGGVYGWVCMRVCVHTP